MSTLFGAMGALGVLVGLGECWGRMGTMEMLYEIHSKTETLHKIHRIFVTLI